MWSRPPAALVLAIALAASYAAPGLAREDVAKPVNLIDTEAVEEAVPAESVLHSAKKALHNQLRRPHGQIFNASVALVAGLAMIFNGNFVLKWLVAGAVFLLATIIAENEVESYWSLGDESYLRRVVGVEVGLVCAFIAHQGYEGVMVVLGAVFGSFVAYGVQTSAQGIFEFDIKQSPQWVAVALYSIIILFFTSAVARKKHLGFLGIISSFFGGALAVTALHWFATEYVVKHNVQIRYHGADLVPKQGPYIDFLVLLFGQLGDDQDVGLFASDPSMPDTVRTFLPPCVWPADRIYMVIVWFFLFVVGCCLQKGKGRQAKARELEAHMEPLLPQ